MRVLGIIPARGGSKGVLRKNLRHIGGKSLIEHAVTAAAHSRLTKFVGSTEDLEIAQEFERFGCTNIERPEELAMDASPIVPVLKDVLDKLAGQGELFDWVVLIQPTCPFRNSADIDAVLEIIGEGGCRSIVSLYPVEDNHPSRMYRLADGLLKPVLEEPKSRRRQDLEPIYHRNGAIYAFEVALLREEDTIISTDVKPYIMPKERSFNIDTELDLFIAEKWYQYQSQLK